MAVVKSLQKEHHVSTVRWYCCSWNQELVFPFHSWPTACVITALKDQEKPSPKISFMASSLTTSIFFMFQIKHPTYQEKKAFRNGMCPINVKKTDGIKQVMKCIDQGYEDYSTVLSFTGDKQLIPMYNLRRSRIIVNVSTPSFMFTKCAEMAHIKNKNYVGSGRKFHVIKLVLRHLPGQTEENHEKSRESRLRVKT